MKPKFFLIYEKNNKIWLFLDNYQILVDSGIEDLEMAENKATVLIIISTYKMFKNKNIITLISTTLVVF